MKKMLLSLALTCIASLTFGQSGFYLKAGLGPGISNASYRMPDMTQNSYGNFVLSGDALIGVGYRKDNWLLESGIGYWSSQALFKRDYTMALDGTRSISNVTVTFQVKSPHIIVPVWGGYTVNKEGRFTLIPAVGVAAVGNLKQSLTDEVRQKKATIDLPSTDKSIASVAVMLRVEASYRLNSKFSIWLSPQVQQMITPSCPLSRAFVNNLYEQAALLNVGISYHIPTAAKQKQP